jgi:hypothetical protein
MSNVCGVTYTSDNFKKSLEKFLNKTSNRVWYPKFKKANISIPIKHYTYNFTININV